MAFHTLQEPAPSEERVLIPDDTTAEAKVVSLKAEKKPFLNDNGDEIWRYAWRFLITSGEYKDRLVFGETGIKFVAHPDCKFYSWVNSLYGTVLPAGFSFDSDVDLPGMTCRLVVGVRSYTKKGETEERHSNFVKDIFPPVGGGAAVTEEDDPF